jgi:hypothetical protein
MSPLHATIHFKLMSGQFEAPVCLKESLVPTGYEAAWDSDRSRCIGVEVKNPCSWRESKSHCPAWVTLLVEVPLSSGVGLIRLCHRYSATRSFRQGSWFRSFPSPDFEQSRLDFFCTILHEWKSLHTSVPCMYSNSWMPPPPFFLSFLCDWHVHNWQSTKWCVILLNLSYCVLYC